MGKVPSPKKNRTKPAFNGESAIMDVIKALYTIPQGNRPFKTPSKNNLKGELLLKRIPIFFEENLNKKLEDELKMGAMIESFFLQA